MFKRFQANMQYGHKMESRVLEYLGDFVKAEFAPKNRSFKEWDIKLMMKDESTETYEIKADRSCIRTGNFFIKSGDELNRPAGIRTSKADYYVLIKADAGDNIICVYVIDTESLRDLEHNNQCKRMGPPYSENYGFLLPEKTLEKMAEDHAVNERI